MASSDGKPSEHSKWARGSGESIVYLHDVVKILVKDDVLIENWKRFYYSLMSPSIYFARWDIMYENSTMTMEEILMEMLSNWVMALGNEAKVGRLLSALISEKFMSVADVLNDEYNLSCTIVEMAASPCINQLEKTNSDVDIPILFDLSEPTDNFAGRAKELQMLDKFYQKGMKVIVVSGLGGVGKSELVRKFGIKFRNDVRGSCIWIPGDCEESSKNSFKRLADRFSLNFESETDIVNIFKEVYNRKLKQWPVLIIVDNVDQSNSLVVKLIKVCKSLVDNIPLILVTTRNKSALQMAGKNLELKMLEQGEAVQMVTNGLGSGVSLSEATKLCDALDHFPLIVQQAISFIKQKRSDPFEQNISVSEYLELFDKQKEKLMDSPLSIDDNYNSTTFATWRMILDNLKQMNGSTGLLAVNILRTLSYFSANDVYLSQLVRFYQDGNMPHKTCIESQSEQSRLDSEEIKGAIRLIEAYSMCRVDRCFNTRLGGDLRDYKISSHRLIRDFMLLCRDTEIDKEIIQRLFFMHVHPWYFDMQNVDELGQRYKTLVAEMFTIFWKLDVDDGQICSSVSEICRENFYQALENDGLNIHFALKFEKPIVSFLSRSRTMLSNCYKIYQYARTRYGLGHFVTKSIQLRLVQCVTLEGGTIPIDIVIRFLVDMIDNGLADRLELTNCCDSIVDALQNRHVTREMSEVLMALKETIINCYDFNEGYNQLFTLSILTTISLFFKQSRDTERFNQIQSEMFCLIQHSSELTEVMNFMNLGLGNLSLPVQAFIFNNWTGMIDVGTFNNLLKEYPREYYKYVTEIVENLFDGPNRMCHLDLFAIATVTMDWLQDNRYLLSKVSKGLDSHITNKDLVIKVVETIKTFRSEEFIKDDLLSLYAEIKESVRNDSVNNYEIIWSLGQIYKALSMDLSVEKHMEFVDFLERLSSTDKEKDLFKTILYSKVDHLMRDTDMQNWNDSVIAVYLRLQKYGVYFTMLKQILLSASIEQIIAIGDNIIENHTKGFINKSDTFLAIKQVVKSFLRKGGNINALETLCKTLNIKSAGGSSSNSLFEKVTLIVVDMDDVNIAIATFFYLVECRDLDVTPRLPSIILRQILRIIGHDASSNPTTLLAFCYEIYHFHSGWYTLICWALIQTLKCLVETNKNEYAERFLRNIIKKTKAGDEWVYRYKACWFLVFGAHYKGQLDIHSNSDSLKVGNCVNDLEWFEALIKD